LDFVSFVPCCDDECKSGEEAGLTDSEKESGQRGLGTAERNMVLSLLLTSKIPSSTRVRQSKPQFGTKPIPI
jgi:hypothetical protein